MRLSGVGSRVLAVVGMMAMGGSALGQSDECAGAPPLPMGEFTPSLAGATSSGPLTCEGTEAADVWYSFTPATDGVLCLTSCFATGRATSPWYSVYSGCPGTEANVLVCTQRDSWECWPSRSTRVEAPVEGGRTYYVRTTQNSSVYTWFEAARPPRSVGADLITGTLGMAGEYLTSMEPRMVSYAWATTGCNIGDETMPWTAADFSNEHPVISSAMYRVKDGVFEQLGLSWLKHGFASETESYCNWCPTSGANPFLLPGCADTYVAIQNGSQNELGRRSEVNPTTGYFPYPPASAPPVTNTYDRRVSFLYSKIRSSQNPGARYFAESQYVSAADAVVGNGLNNVSYREFPFATGSQTVRTKPAIVGWAEMDPTVTLRAVDHEDGGYVCRYWVAAKVTETAPGRWRYVYAVFNLNSNRAARGFSVPRRADVQLWGQEVRFVPPHPGEPYSVTPWGFSGEDAELRWASAEGFAQNPNANALRWGNAYTMIVEASTPPAEGDVRLELFAPGAAGDAAWLDVRLPAPSQGACVADFNGDLFVDFFDYGDFVSAFERGAQAADVNGDEFLDFFDYAEFVGVFEGGC